MECGASSADLDSFSTWCVTALSIASHQRLHHCNGDGAKAVSRGRVALIVIIQVNVIHRPWPLRKARIRGLSSDRRCCLLCCASPHSGSDLDVVNVVNSSGSGSARLSLDSAPSAAGLATDDVNAGCRRGAAGSDCGLSSNGQMIRLPRFAFRISH